MQGSLVLAGAAATGKTTVAKMLGSLVPGAVYVEVEARECWPISDPALREECFIESFLSVINPRGPYIHDNALLSVYGYSRALEALATSSEARRLRLIAGKALEAQEELLAKGSRTVLLTASHHAMTQRILARTAAEAERTSNSVEHLIPIHVDAQKHMEEAASKIGIPIIDTTELPPQQIAINLLKLWGKL